MSAQIGALVSANALIGRFLKQPKSELVDRLCSKITVGLLTICSTILLSTHFWGEPITCWTPAQYVKHWTDFVNQFCYVHGTYFVPFDQGLEYVSKERRRYPIVYYQWVGNLPGFDLNGTIQHCERLWNDVKANDAKFSGRLSIFEKQGAVFVWDGIFCARRKRSRYIMMYYCLCTILQALNAWLEFYFLNALLCSATYALWGPGIIADLARGIDWQVTGHFPRITHCDYVRRAPATVQEDTVLCVLHLNIYYEKLFLFLWFWLLTIAILATAHSVVWCLSVFTTNSIKKTIRQYLSDTTNSSLERFLNALGKDGIFILHHIALNIGDLPASYLTQAMKKISDEWEISSRGELEAQALLQKGPKAV
uniref:Innexin n=1 Tax=Syphacia muris TaxID=451379 RepID=A0A0N5AYG4_9BILA